jgi:hypothetical protein
MTADEGEVPVLAPDSPGPATLAVQRDIAALLPLRQLSDDRTGLLRHVGLSWLGHSDGERRRVHEPEMPATETVQRNIPKNSVHLVQQVLPGNPT